MSTADVNWARTVEAPISSLARLALLGMADSAHEYGLVNEPIHLAAPWTHVGAEANASALTELERFSLAYVADQDDAGLASVAFIAVTGWEVGYRHWVKAHTKGDVAPYPPVPPATRLRVFERDGWRCVFCAAAERLSIDHIHPRSLGGTNTLANLQTLCVPCNSTKSDRLISQQAAGVTA